MKDFTAQFANAVAELDRQKIEIPTRVHAYNMMLSARIPEQSRPAVMADVRRGEVTMAAMTSTLNFMFDSLSRDEGQAVYAVGKGGRRQKSTHCYRCGEEGHVSKECRFAGEVCFHCKQPGHKAQGCQKQRENGGLYSGVVLAAWLGLGSTENTQGQTVAVLDTGASETVIG